MESRTDPMAPNTIGDDSVGDEIAGEQEPLKMNEVGYAPPPGALDTAFPDTSPTESAKSDPGMFGGLDSSDDPSLSGDPGQLPGSRDPSFARSSENDDRPGPKEGGTPYDAEGTSGSEGE
jgi:hypothetical protein